MPSRVSWNVSKSWIWTTRGKLAVCEFIEGSVLNKARFITTDQAWPQHTVADVA